MRHALNKCKPAKEKMEASRPSSGCSLKALLLRAACFCVICLYWGVHGLPRSPHLTHRLRWAFLHQLCGSLPLSVLPCEYARVHSLVWPGSGQGLAAAGFQGTMSTEAISLHPHTCCNCELDCVSGSWLLGTGDSGHTVWPSSRAPFWEQNVGTIGSGCGILYRLLTAS